jgi:serine phosphatase RsbU (regulator of sigma subunit)/pSer/pThr/pTyr-binding forkhead associated (FHA) protein
MAFLRAPENSVLDKKVFSITSASSRVGRYPDCEIFLDHAGVSREHARITLDKSGYHIEDLKSRNGTFLNGHPVTEPTLLHEGDVVKFCDLELIFSSGEPMRVPRDSQSSSVRTSQVFVSDDADEQPFTVKSQINLGDKKPTLTSANAAVKLQAMIDIGRNLGAAVDDVLQQLSENLLKIFPQADCVFILLNDKQTGRLEPRKYLHRDPANQESVRISRTILEKVAFSKAAIFSDDIANDSRFEPSDSIVNFSIYSIMAAPIMDYDQSEVLGVIQVDTRSRGQKFTYEDLDLLVSLAYQVAVSYQNAKLQEVAIEEQVMEREMNIARKVQMGLLPTEPPVVAGYEFFDYYKAARHLGGDYYDYIPLPDGRLIFTLGDVSGKGVSAALLMAKLSAEVRYGLLIEPSLHATVKRLNRSFAESRWDNRFITFFFGAVDPKTHRIQFFNAGHLPPILVSPDGTTQLLGEETISLPLGVMEDSEYTEVSLTIENGQNRVIISNGTTDAMNAQEQCLTIQGVLDHIKQSRTPSVSEFGKNLISAVQSFAGRTPQTDDQSLLIVGRRDEEQK